MTSLLHQPGYDPNNLLDVVSDMLGLKSDAALCGMLGIAPSIISKIRHGRMEVGPGLLISLHDATGLSIRHLRILMGDRREHFSGPTAGAAQRMAAFSERLRRLSPSEPNAMPPPSKIEMPCLNEPGCDPGQLFDAVIDILDLKSDAALAKALGLTSAAISNLRKGRLGVGPTLLLRVHEVSGLPIADLRALMDGRRALRALPASHADVCGASTQ